MVHDENMKQCGVSVDPRSQQRWRGGEEPLPGGQNYSSLPCPPALHIWRDRLSVRGGDSSAKAESSGSSVLVPSPGTKDEGKSLGSRILSLSRK